MKRTDRANYIKLGIVTILVVIGCSVSGCGANGISKDVVEEQEEKEVIADEFECVYMQTQLGTNHIGIYRHIPTDMMYVCYVNRSMSPMGITYDEYVEKARQFHAENDTVSSEDDGEETDGLGME